MARPAATDCVSDEQLAAFISGELPSDAVAAVEAHLASCEHCMRLLGVMGSATAPTGQEGPRRAGAPPPPLDADGALAPGTRVGRYVIASRVGGGAMGTVYAAHDPELRRDVAIKVMRDREGEGATAARAERMRREARAMARLSHPSVITVHDVGTLEGRTFVAMELIRGGTLREWLEARPRSTEAILDVLVRAGQGLAAAHAAGLVHRDFKPDNVLVSDDGRVLVTDFGLARRADEVVASDGKEGGARPPESLPPSLALTRTGTVLGTPAYMAPEQLAGERADARSDVFSFCVSAYAALYGERPFAGSLSALRDAIAAGRVRDAPQGSTVPARVRDVLLSGLRADPAARPASMQALLAALARARASGPRRAALVAAAGVALIAAVAGAASLRQRAPAPLDTAAPGMRPAVAVLAVGADAPAVANAGDALRAALGAGGALRVVSDDELTQAEADARVDPRAPLTRDGLAALRALLHADYVVEASVPVAAPAGALHARVVRAATGEVLGGVAATASAPELAEAAFSLGLDARRALGAPSPSPADLAAARAELGGPDAPMTHLALAWDLDRRGLDERAADEARRAVGGAGALSREDRLAVEGARAMIERDWEKATGAYRALVALVPDRLDHALRLLDAERRHQRFDDAEQTLAAIRRSPPPLAGDPRVDLAEAVLALSRGDAGRALRAADAARASSEALGARSVALRAAVEHAVARARAGEGGAAAEELRACVRLAGEGDAGGEGAYAKEQLAGVLADAGRYDEAGALLAEALDASTKAGREGRAAETLHAMAVLARRRGDDATARRLYEEALAREVSRGGVKRDVAAARSALGTLLLEMGEVGAAREQHEAALALRVEARSGAGESESQIDLAAVALLAGDLGVARERAQAALARATAAKASLREASARLALAQVEAEGGSGNVVRDAFERACEALRAQASAEEAACRARYAGVLLRAGAAEEATAQAARAEAIAAAVDAWPVRREVSVRAARVQGMTGVGGRRAARTRLEALAAEAQRAGAALWWMEATLALGEVEIADGAARDGRRRLASLARDAEGRGALSIARRAAASAR